MGLRRSFKPTNLVANGNFAKGTSGWAATNSTITATDNILRVTGNGSAINPRCNQIILSLVSQQNKKTYIRTYARVTSADCERIWMYWNVAGASRLIPTPVQNQWYLVSDVGVSNFGPIPALFISQQYEDASTSVGKVLEIRECCAIDLSVVLPADILTLSNNDLKTWCDVNIPNWFDGTLGGGVINGTGGLK